MRALGAKAFPDAETVLDNALSPITAIRAQHRARAEQAGTARSVPQLGRTA
ncbi:hypothetical protein ACFRQM_37880 [Streptomyces sp. NPDC056831]|uniref:hypothetical protein n=1 Tax=Streptomyces sp. NPDC056831 TaxID=3345954 RepID=UPI003694E2BC